MSGREYVQGQEAKVILYKHVHTAIYEQLAEGEDSIGHRERERRDRSTSAS